MMFLRLVAVYAVVVVASKYFELDLKDIGLVPALIGTFILWVIIEIVISGGFVGGGHGGCGSSCGSSCGGGGCGGGD